MASPGSEGFRGVLPGLLGNNRTRHQSRLRRRLPKRTVKPKSTSGHGYFAAQVWGPLGSHNKRPITWLNVDYKLLAKALCNRLALAMPHLVGDLQTCAVKGHWSLHPAELVVDARLASFVVPGGAKVKCIQYADDVTCVVSSLGSFRASRRIYLSFERATGAKLNPKRQRAFVLVAGDTETYHSVRRGRIRISKLMVYGSATMHLVCHLEREG
ncbi:hypothetical protein BSL78_10091 [Apostichopus japonicus]|uniref:Reverse transcriptase domain-containing protein n=1 Tax=Stichopus japonicus TaxID=307972 RepID=A0A2G8KYP4_STIJA|nr:hypothetical protein BSL78_10091 [Apostichopus japonicus]